MFVMALHASAYLASHPSQKFLAFAIEELPIVCDTVISSSQINFHSKNGNWFLKRHRNSRVAN